MSCDEAFDSNDAGYPIPLRLDALLTSRPQTHLISEAGPNYTPAGSCTIDAKDDLEAINAWLLEHPESRSTARAYRKEIERFYNWLVLIQRKSLGSVSPDDIDAYDAFMTAPPRAWCGPRNGRHETKRWRPFESGLSAESRSQAKTILRVCFSYLVAVRYLVGSPMWRRTRKCATGERNINFRERYIPLPAFRKLIQALELQADNLSSNAIRSIATAERQLFVVRFLANTGLRGEELANAHMSDIECEEHPLTGWQYWTMSVGRSRNSYRKIIVNATALEALHRYRCIYKRNNSLYCENSPVLLPLSGDTTPQGFLSAQMVYTTTVEALKIASLHYAVSDAQTSALLNSASPHWFRATFAAIAAQCGIPHYLIQKQLGASSSSLLDSLWSDADAIESFEMMAMLKN